MATVKKADIESVVSTEVKVTGKAPSIVETEEILGSPVFDSPYAEVEFGAGITKSLGNFESLRISVSIRLPCKADGVEKAYDEVRALVDEKISKELNMVRQAKTNINEKKKGTTVDTVLKTKYDALFD